MFTNGIEQELAEVLESLGVIVQGKRLGNMEDKNIKKTMEETSISKVNLDVSAMLAYVSSVTNGSSDKYEFSVPVLSQQAKWERERPQKPILEEFFKGNFLY